MVQPSKPRANGRQRKAAFDGEFNRTAKAARAARETHTIFDTDSEDNLDSRPKAGRPEPKKPTEEDQRDAEDANSDSEAKRKQKMEGQTGGKNDGPRQNFEVNLQQN